MMSDRRLNRRRFVTGVSALGVGVLAGCSSSSESDGDSSSTGTLSAEETGTPEGNDPDTTSTATTTTQEPETVGNDGGDSGSRVEVLKERYSNWAFIDGQTHLVVLKPIDASADSYSITISGEIVNGSESDYDYAQISFGLYSGSNGSGAKVGNAIDNISGLASGQRWAFEAIGTADDASSFDIDDTTAY